MKRHFLWVLAAAPALSVQIEAGPLVQFRTPLGDIEVELFEDKPVTTGNFIRYVQSGAYQDMFFHRWAPFFVIQGGGFFVQDRGMANPVIQAAPNFGMIRNEFEVGERRSNTYGTLAMAKQAGGPDTASSQWFFNLGDNSANLDAQNGGFTVFGRVIRGTNVLNRFNNVTVPNGIFMANLDPPLDELPVLSANPTYGDLVYVDVTMLDVQVELKAGGSREISWNSMAGLVHHVEFTTRFPPDWQVLVTATGTGDVVKVVDESATAERFYRVRVEY